MAATELAGAELEAAELARAELAGMELAETGVVIVAVTVAVMVEGEVAEGVKVVVPTTAQETLEPPGKVVQDWIAETDTVGEPGVSSPLEEMQT